MKYQWTRATNPAPPTLLTEANGLLLGVNSSSPLTPSFGTFSKKTSTPPKTKTPVSVVLLLFRYENDDVMMLTPPPAKVWF